VARSAVWQDPIVGEIRKYRDQYAAKFYYDLKIICRDLRERQQHGGRRVVSLPPNPTQPTPSNAS
jgi:hypothetical protein